jgi:hypothetical protein
VYVFTTSTAGTTGQYELERASGGTGDFYAMAADNAALDIADANDFCFEAWATVPVAGTARWIASKHATGAGTAGWSVGVSSGDGVSVEWGDSAFNGTNSSSTVLVLEGTPTHFMMCIDDSTRIGYAWADTDPENGAATSAGTDRAGAIDTTEPLRFFAIDATGTLDGAINEFRMYKGAQASLDIGNAATRTSIGTAFSTHHTDGPDGTVQTPLDTFLVARWSFNEGTGTTATDSEGPYAATEQGSVATWAWTLLAGNGPADSSAPEFLALPPGGVGNPCTRLFMGSDTYLNVGLETGATANGRVTIMEMR